MIYSQVRLSHIQSPIVLSTLRILIPEYYVQMRETKVEKTQDINWCMVDSVRRLL